jgi:hypothetical protein
MRVGRGSVQVGRVAPPALPGASLAVQVCGIGWGLPTLA